MHNLLVNLDFDGYSNPLDPNLWKAGPPIAGDLQTVIPTLPTVEEIILRLFYGWMVLRVKTLCDLTGYSERTIMRFLPGLVKRNLVTALGCPIRGHSPGPRQILYTLGSKSPTEPPYDFRPRLRYKDWDKKSLHDAHGLRTTDDKIVPVHPYYVTESAAWIARELAGVGMPCLAVPEHVLRYEYGWYSPKKDQSKRYFNVPVPDAWLLFRLGSFRLEVQLSETSVKKVRDVCDGSLIGEPVLYVVTDESLYERFRPLLDEYPFFFLVRFGNAQDLASVPARYDALRKRGGIKRWPLRDYYAGTHFALAVMKPERALLFDRQHPNSGTL